MMKQLRHSNHKTVVGFLKQVEKISRHMSYGFKIKELHQSGEFYKSIAIEAKNMHKDITRRFTRG